MKMIDLVSHRVIQRGRHEAANMCKRLVKFNIMHMIYNNKQKYKCMHSLENSPLFTEIFPEYKRCFRVREHKSVSESGLWKVFTKMCLSQNDFSYRRQYCVISGNNVYIVNIYAGHSFYDPIDICTS